jgi:hypothetical protein
MKVKKAELFSPAERILMSEFVATEYWPLYKKMLNHCLNNVMKINLGSATWEETLINRGKAAQITWELNQFRKINKEVQLEKAKRKAKGAKNASKV